jgi:hypothetical protein
VTHASSSSSVLSGSIRPLTVMVIVLIFVMFSSSGVILAQFSSPRIISGGGKDPVSFWDVEAKEGLDWFQKWTETDQWNQQQHNAFDNGKIDGPNNTMNTIQAAVGVGIYWDTNFSFPVSSLDWGNVFPGSVKNITVFIRNEGDEPSTLFLKATNWSPLSASDFMVLNWGTAIP